MTVYVMYGFKCTKHVFLNYIKISTRRSKSTYSQYSPHAVMTLYVMYTAKYTKHVFFKLYLNINKTLKLNII